MGVRTRIYRFCIQILLQHVECEFVEFFEQIDPQIGTRTKIQFDNFDNDLSNLGLDIPSKHEYVGNTSEYMHVNHSNAMNSPDLGYYNKFMKSPSNSESKLTRRSQRQILHDANYRKKYQ